MVNKEVLILMDLACSIFISLQKLGNHKIYSFQDPVCSRKSFQLKTKVFTVEFIKTVRKE